MILKSATVADGPDEGVKRAIIAGPDSIEHSDMASVETLNMMNRNGTYIVPTQYTFEDSWKEFPTLVKNGISPLRTLKAATSMAAEMLRRPDLGYLELSAKTSFFNIVLYISFLIAEQCAWTIHNTSSGVGFFIC